MKATFNTANSSTEGLTSASDPTDIITNTPSIPKFSPAMGEGMGV